MGITLVGPSERNTPVPPSAACIKVEVVGDRQTDDHYLAEVAPSTPIDPVPLPPVTITNVKTGDDSMSFEVDRIGVPVLVRASYFPNWKVEGGTGPYRAAPNLMVVIPTSNKVSASR